MRAAIPALVCVVLLAASTTEAATYYVRTDGGSASQCTGLANAAYPGSGSNQACAWNHPFWALPPGGVQALRISGGDTLLIGPGQYMLGYGAPNSVDCDSGGRWDCVMPALPAGPSALARTRLLGVGHDSGCATPPQFWGSERATHLLDLRNASRVDVACLELTDHSGCIEFHSGGLACERDTPPYGPWADTGIVAWDAADVSLRDLDIHGLAVRGVLAGRLADLSVERVRIGHNGWVGWDGDIPNFDGNSGTLRFSHWIVEWNGCAQTWPGLVTGGCWAQEAGGYGDGVGLGAGGGRWVISDSRFNYNTSDGLDLLYLDQPSAQIELRRVEARGNAGNQIKTRGHTLIENSIIVGNCGFFAGQPFTYQVDHCRALGSALNFDLNAGTQIQLINSTLYSEGDCIIGIDNSGCNGSESIMSRNNVFVGDTDFLQSFELTCFAYNNGCPGNPLNQDYGVIFNVKENPCPLASNDLCGSPQLANQSADSFDAMPQAASPALDSGLPVGGLIPALDFRSYERPYGSGVDRGALERGAGPMLFADGFEG